MSENGYIRKIDELGRIVIPKEVRKKLKIHEGESLQINCYDKGINIIKYSHIENNYNFINMIGDKANFMTNLNIIITDVENIIYSNNVYPDIKLKTKVKSYIDSRNSAVLSSLSLNNNINISGNIVIEPIISNSLCLGLVIVFDDKINEYVSKIAKLLSSIISIHIDES